MQKFAPIKNSRYLRYFVIIISLCSSCPYRSGCQSPVTGRRSLTLSLRLPPFLQCPLHKVNDITAIILYHSCYYDVVKVWIFVKISSTLLVNRCQTMSCIYFFSSFLYNNTFFESLSLSYHLNYAVIHHYIMYVSSWLLFIYFFVCV